MTAPARPPRSGARAGRSRHVRLLVRRTHAARRLVAALVVVALGLVVGAGTALSVTAGSPAAALDAVVGRVVPQRTGVAAPLPGPSVLVPPELAGGGSSSGLLPRSDPASRSESLRTPLGPLPGGGPPAALSPAGPGRGPFVPPAPVVRPDDLVPPVVVLPPGLTQADVDDGLRSAQVPQSGGGTFAVVPGSDPGPGTGRVRTVRVEVEDGLAADGARFAAVVMATLNDPRGWGGDGSVSFARTDGPAELRVMLASPTSTDTLCAPLRTDGEVSCGRAGHAVLNVRRWVLATDEYADRHAYRQYLVNHEVGHLLGHAHETCPGPGAVAPVMQQQSYRVAPCLPNSWPFPDR